MTTSHLLWTRFTRPITNNLRFVASLSIQLTALNPKENDFDTMYQQLKDLKEGKTIQKPIYNHVNGTLDTPETIEPTPIVIVEGLHPMYDSRVRDLLDFSLYLDISDEVKVSAVAKRQQNYQTMYLCAPPVCRPPL